MGIRGITGLIALLIFLLLAFSGLVAAPQQSSPIEKDSPAGRSVAAAAESLRSLGDRDMADAVLESLKKGALLSLPRDKSAQQSKEAPPADPVVLDDRVILLPASYLPEKGAFTMERDYDRITKLSWVLTLALGTAPRSPLLTVSESLCPGSVRGERAVSAGARLRALDRMTRWCIALCDKHNSTDPEDYEARYYLLQKIVVILTNRAALTDYFLADREFGGDAKFAACCREWASIDRDIITRTKRIMEAYEEAAWDDLIDVAWVALSIIDATSRAERVTKANRWLPQWAKDRFSDALAAGIITGVTIEAMTDETVTTSEVDALYRLYFDRDRLAGEKCFESAPWRSEESEVALALIARDCLPGDGVTATLGNASKAPLKVKIPAGIIFVPSDKAYRRLVVGAPVEVECAPGESKTFTLSVYTVDGLKAPLPSREPAMLTWSVCEDLAAARSAGAVIAAAWRMSEEGRLAAGAADPGRHINDVIQVALWQHLRRIGDPAGWELIKVSLESRWALLPAESRPSLSEQSRVIEAIWKDARAVVAEVEKQGRP
jgi:hypothetical protein